MSSDLQKQAGFTLIEVLIVVLVLGIMAMVIVPQVRLSSQDAQLTTLKANLSILRKAIEKYYVQHDTMYPGYIRLSGGGFENKDGEYLSTQLTRYTSIDGVISNIKDATYRFGPYISGGGGMPINPFQGNDDVFVNYTKTDITHRNPTGETGWKFYAQLGVIFANDLDHRNL